MHRDNEMETQDLISVYKRQITHFYSVYNNKDFIHELNEYMKITDDLKKFFYNKILCFNTGDLCSKNDNRVVLLSYNPLLSKNQHFDTIKAEDLSDPCSEETKTFFEKEENYDFQLFKKMRHILTGFYSNEHYLYTNLVNLDFCPFYSKKTGNIKELMKPDQNENSENTNLANKIDTMRKTLYSFSTYE